MARDPRPNELLYGVYTRWVTPKMRKNRNLLRFMGGMDGFVCSWHPEQGSVLWLYDSRQNATRARDAALSEGVEAFHEVPSFLCTRDGIPEKVLPAC